MTIVGDKGIFAIEWNTFITDYNNHIRDYGVTFGVIHAELSYIANNQLIDRNSTMLGQSFNHVKKHVENYEIYHNFAVDFSGISKEDVYNMLFRCMYNDNVSEYCSDSDNTDCFICPEQYREFYAHCKQQMVKDYYTNRIPWISKNEMNESILRGEDYSEDSILGNWIHGTFYVADLAGDALLNSHIYLVRDIAMNQERLIWKRFAKYDKERNMYHEFPVCEAIIPVGYFKSVQEEFASIALKEMEMAKTGIHPFVIIQDRL